MLLPLRASVNIKKVKPIIAARPFQFSALVLQNPFAKGSFLQNIVTSHSAMTQSICKVCDELQMLQIF